MKLTPVSVRRFTAAGTCDSRSTVTARFAGDADIHVVGEMNAFLEDLHAAASRIRATHVVVDLRDLDFACASCFTAFARWLTQVQALRMPYRVSFMHEPAKYWQLRSLQTLRSFGVDVVSTARRPPRQQSP